MKFISHKDLYYATQELNEFLLFPLSNWSKHFIFLSIHTTTHIHTHIHSLTHSPSLSLSLSHTHTYTITHTQTHFLHILIFFFLASPSKGRFLLLEKIRSSLSRNLISIKSVIQEEMCRANTAGTTFCMR